MASLFAARLKELVDARYSSRREFIRTAEGVKDEDSGQSYLARVIDGTRPPPLDRVERWADALDLAGQEREKFLDLAAAAHVPESHRARLETLILSSYQVDRQNLETRMQDLERSVRAVQGRLDDQSAQASDEEPRTRTGDA